MDNNQLRDKRIAIRLTETELEKIKQCASEDNRSTSDWVRNLILTKLAKKEES